MKSTPLIGAATLIFGTQQLIDGQRASQIILDFEFVPADFGPKARDSIGGDQTEVKEIIKYGN